MFETTDVSAARRMGKPEGLERSESKGLGLRVFIGKQQAIVSTTDTHKDTLTELAERAIAMAKAAPADPDGTLAPDALIAHAIPDLDLLDADEPGIEWLMEQCKQAEEAALSVKGITNSEGADAHYSRKSLVLLAIAARARRTALRITINSSHFSVSVSVLAGRTALACSAITIIPARATAAI